MALPDTSYYLLQGRLFVSWLIHRITCYKGGYLFLAWYIVLLVTREVICFLPDTSYYLLQGRLFVSWLIHRITCYKGGYLFLGWYIVLLVTREVICFLADTSYYLLQGRLFVSWLIHRINCYKGGYLFLGCLTSQQHAVYLRDGSAQTSLRSATLRHNLQTKLSISPSHNILTMGRPVPALTL